MRFKVRAQSEPDVAVEFWLVVCDDAIELHAVRTDDEDRYPWAVLTITPKGLRRFVGLSDDLGFPIDGAGQIVLV